LKYDNYVPLKLFIEIKNNILVRKITFLLIGKTIDVVVRKEKM